MSQVHLIVWLVLFGLFWDGHLALDHRKSSPFRTFPAHRNHISFSIIASCLQNHLMLRTFTMLTVLAVAGLSGGPALADCQSSNPTVSDFPDSLVTMINSSGIQSAWYDDATDRYAHGVLGDAIEPSTLVVKDEKDCTRSVVLDQKHVFEDLAPRLADIDGIPGNEVITIRSHREFGAQVVIYQLSENEIKLLASTPYIGTSNRWLAPVGIADFNNDGDMDIAYVDRPHLAKTLRVWSYRDGKLHQIANKHGYSNHRIGEDFISGGLKSCDKNVAMITADSSWNRILETTLKDNRLSSRDIGEFQGPESLSSALLCE